MAGRSHGPLHLQGMEGQGSDPGAVVQSGSGDLQLLFLRRLWGQPGLGRGQGCPLLCRPQEVSQWAGVHLSPVLCQALPRAGEGGGQVGEPWSST